MEYSSDDIAAARSLQLAAYCQNPLFFALTQFSVDGYILVDIFTSIALEQGKRLVCCYAIPPLYHSHHESISNAECFTNINTGFCIVSVICSECFFIIRTYALWNKNKILLAAVLSAFCMQLARSWASQGATTARLVFGSSYHFSSLPGSNWTWRISPTRLYVVLVKHNIFYYTCGFLFSVTNIFASMHLHYSYHALLYDFQFMILAILATRMHLHLWVVNRHAHSSGAPRDVSSCGLFGVVRGARLALYEMTGGG
ncbi:uncharacterized protein BJ212DRAFT_1592989 [Suillus subaureus]|uniref:Uncharacterized protein n=1 Tax=Suillus subaureus TaxID=48587 RepID=A0A9P7ALN8_9AGAM|nr:uncharacterized protein BJ212DRAFT_1592989 [Suillus subaureus]KAG1791971.1 hypothetical protein BJ212DRAFT_1592989 [Suillus subaureus]